VPGHYHKKPPETGVFVFGIDFFYKCDIIISHQLKFQAILQGGELMADERTLLVIKPDGVKKKAIG